MMSLDWIDSLERWRVALVVCTGNNDTLYISVSGDRRSERPKDRNCLDERHRYRSNGISVEFFLYFCCRLAVNERIKVITRILLEKSERWY